MFRLYLLASISFMAGTLSGQSVLDQYVKEAIENNPSIREKELLEDKSALSVRHAGQLYGPEIKFLTTYTLAGGGRSIDLPIGDLLNGPYADLNQLLMMEKYRSIENQSVQFLPHNFYDARFRLTQPILQPDIKYNRLIKEEELTLSKLTTQQSKRDLIQSVKTTYLQWMQAHEAIQIIEQGLTLLNENKRITESLIRNGVGIPSALIRIESEIATVQAQLQKAKADQANAAHYFNFLLQRNPEAPIEADSIPTVPELPAQLTADAREELKQIESGNQIQSLALRLEEKYNAPRLGLQVDAGSQAYAPDWGGYVLGAVQLEIPIWNNTQTRTKRQEWETSIAATGAKLEWTKEVIETQLQNEIRSLEADLVIYNSYASVLKSNQRLYSETLKRYKEGLANYIELLDARTQVTNAELEQNIAKYQAWLRQVNIERISATAVLP